MDPLKSTGSSFRLLLQSDWKRSIFLFGVSNTTYISYFLLSKKKYFCLFFDVHSENIIICIKDFRFCFVKTPEIVRLSSIKGRPYPKVKYEPIFTKYKHAIHPVKNFIYLIGILYSRNMRKNLKD